MTVEVDMNLSVKEAARLLSVSEKTIYRWIKQEIIPAYRIHEQYRFKRAELVEWATSRRIGASRGVFLDQEIETFPRLTLADALESGGIFYRISGKDRDQVLTDIVEHLRLPEEVDRPLLLKFLIARENLGSTGIGNGLALPHPRNPGLLHITHPTVTLCFLENPIAYDALDGQPIDTLFTLLAPDLPSHLRLLSRLGYLLQRPALRQLITPPGNREAILETLRREEQRLHPFAPFKP